MDQRPASDGSYASGLPCAVLIAAPGSATSAVSEALSLLDTRHGDPIPPREAAERLSHQQCLLDHLAVEAWSMTDADLDDLLPHVATTAASGRTRVVVAMHVDQIDRVAAALLGTRATLLCEPTLADRVAALAIPAKLDQSVHDNDASPKPAEIARLSAEVERIARTLAKLTGSSEAPAVRDSHDTAFSQPAPGASDVSALTVRAAIRARRLREQFIDPELLGEPAWDILLDLLAAELEQLRVSVSSLCIAAAVPPTTALRWITGMTEAGLLERHADAADRRRAFVTLAAGASTAMRNYFAALQRQGLPFG